MRGLVAMSPAIAATAGAYLTRSQDIEPWKQFATALLRERAADTDAALVDDALFTFDVFEKAWHVAEGERARTAPCISSGAPRH
jgi:hypothetical protein